MENIKPSILIIEDHEIVAIGLKSLINSESIYETTDLANSAKQAIEMAEASPYNLYVIDVELPDMSGIELIKHLKVSSPDSVFIFYTQHDELWILRQMIDCGTDAIVMKSDDVGELKVAIEHVLNGNSYFSPRFRSCCENMAHQSVLSKREIEILKLIAEGYKSRDIAEKLYVSENTIEFHRRRVMKKLGASNMAQLVKEAIAKGYILI